MGKGKEFSTEEKCKTMSWGVNGIKSKDITARMGCGQRALIQYMKRMLYGYTYITSLSTNQYFEFRANFQIFFTQTLYETCNACKRSSFFYH
jgi:hypothetical protein